MIDMEFLAKVKTPEDMKAVTGALSALVDEATFEATPEGVHIRAFTTDKIALVDIDLPDACFEEYRCPAPVKFAVKTDELAKYIKRADKADMLTLSLGEDDLLHITTQGKKQLEYKQRLKQVLETGLPLPKINFAANATLTLSLLDDAISDVLTVDGFAIFKAKPGEHFVLGSKGDSAAASRTLADIEELKVSEAAEAVYSLDYMSKWVKALAPVGGSVVCSWSSKVPLRIEARIAQIGKIVFYMAPRVND